MIKLSIILIATSPLTISHDRGGQIIDYSIKALELRESGRSVRFVGPCESACTLLLSLPKHQTCISKRASFAFHLPYGGSAKQNATAANYMIRKYPGWVRTWLYDNGGLSKNLKRMPYSYASRHLNTCN